MRPMPDSPPAPPGPALPPPARLRSLLAAIGHGLLERETAVRLALLAALAGEHVLLIGPPGTAKSALARRVHLAFAGARYFERLLTRFSTPEELFGPLSLKALEDDRYERLTEGFLPTAGIAFLDEVFKANSAILNALLMLLNERCFDNGTARVRTPLVAVVAASNEVPTDEALHAFYDRFLVRVPVAPVGDASFAALLGLADADTEVAPPADALQPAEREALEAAAQTVVLGAEFVEACTALRGWLAARQAALSDRRWRQIVGLARVAAASEGRSELDRLDLWFAPFVASRTPEDVPALEAWFVEDGLAAPPMASPWLERAVQAFEQQLQIEQQAPAEAGALDDDAGKMATLGRAGGAAIDDAGAAPGRELAGLRIVSARLEARLRRRWSPVHIRARVEQVAEIEAQVAAAAAEVTRASETLAAALATRLWLPPALATAIRLRFDAARAVLDALAGRLAAAREGFAALPCDDGAASAEPPAPIEIPLPDGVGALESQTA